MRDPNRTGRGTTDTTPKDFAATNPALGPAGPDFTLQTVLEVQRTIAELGVKVERLMADRKDDRADYRSDMQRMSDDFKEFRQKDFKELRDDVSKLRLKWAWAAGGAAVITVILTFALDLLKEHWH